jgi:uncharacterized protein (TIGR04222 family)
MNPFDLVGLQFLALYASLAAVALVLALGLRRLLRGPADELPEAPRLHPYTMAHLAGGPKQAVDAALTHLVESGVLKLGGKGDVLQLVGEAPEDAHPLEEAILASGDFAFSVKGARAAAARPAERIGVRLRKLGLEMAPTRAWVAGGVVPALLTAVVMFGAAKVIVGLTRGKPVLFLVAGCVVVLILSRIFWRNRPHRTLRGDRLLARLQARQAALRTTALKARSRLQGADLTLAVSLFGVGVLAAGPMAGLSKALTPPANAGADGGCGGGGCGGGGCGGCGGCGG